MTKPHRIPDRKILALSDADDLALADFFEGCIITGASGSGKSSTSGKQIAYSFLRTPGMGGLVLTAKAEETRNWIAYAEKCGRTKDLTVFNAASGDVFDPIFYEFTRAGRGAGDTESTIDFFSTLVSLGKTESAQGHDPFWQRGNEQLMRNCIKLLELAGHRVSIASIDKVIKSLPTRPDEHEDEAWQSQAYCAQLIKAIEARKDTLTEEQWSDLDFATQFAFRKWPAFDERPRSSLEMTWSGMADKFLFNPLNRLFCGGKCSFTPEDALEKGRIVICDFPMLEYGHLTGQTINVLLKLVFQRAFLRRTVTEDSNPAFIWQDELQYFIVPKFDNFFQQTCRGSRIAVVGLTQNILNLSEALGEAQPGSKTKSFCGNLAIKIAHQQNEPDTAAFMADLIGKEYRFLDSFHASSGESGRANTSFGASQQLVHIIEPVEFTRLIKPSSSNPYAQAIVYVSGRAFEATKTHEKPEGQNYLSVLFSR